MTEIAKSERIWFWGLLALAVALRAMNFSVFAMHHPDEVLQYLEPAYRLLTGDGIVTWERKGRNKKKVSVYPVEETQQAETQQAEAQ